MSDTRTGRIRTYTNPDGTAAVPVQDTSAFACTNGDAAPEPGTASERSSDTERLPGRELDALAFPPGAAGAVGLEPAPAVVSGAASSSVDSAACSSSSTAVCIDGRFLLEVRYRAGHGNSGPGQAIPLQSLGVTQGGLFWFFSADNPEMLIKVLDGCGVNQHFWIFYAAGTNVGFTVTVTDTRTGAVKTYVNILGTAAPPVQDTSALPCP